MKIYYYAENEKDAQVTINQFKKDGYKIVSDCYWFVELTNGDKVLTLERDF